MPIMRSLCAPRTNAVTRPVPGISLIGVLVYLIARGGKMYERAVRQAQQQDAEARAYIQQAAASSSASTADQLTKLADLRDRGVISAQEFEREKAKVLAA